MDENLSVDGLNAGTLLSSGSTALFSDVRLKRSRDRYSDRIDV